MPARQCYCQAYPFPHRLGGGNCTLWGVVEEVFRVGLCPRTCQHLVIDAAAGRYCKLIIEEGDPSNCPGLTFITKEIL